MTILITGISGFLGSNLAKHLSLNHTIIGISSKTNLTNIDGIKKVYDYTSEFEKIEEKPEIIILCHASISSGSTKVISKELYDVNVTFTEKVISAFPKSKCIYISSVSVYSELNEVKTEFSFVSPKSEYAISKYWAERKVLDLEKSCIIRFSSLYGKEMKENTLIPNYVNQAFNQGVIEVWGNGSRLQNYFNVEDAILLIEAVIKKSKFEKEIYLGTFEKEYSNIEIAQVIKNIIGAQIKLVNQDNSSSVRYNNEMTKKLLKWNNQIDINKGLEAYISWKRKQF